MLGKILIDLRNTREEAINVVEPKSGEEQSPVLSESKKEEKDYQFKLSSKNDEPHRISSANENILDEDDEDDDKEAKYRLDPK